ncbi:hypothetical protein F4560_001659 [Saccharothrix ecbatanensis]|uniref:Uncharacterized protein n=1 Tax=Saccharothrix ecbatanensis TaxID=1105145 RepID=A0A7W9HH77_9PSEU|nr:hypothetical protein [Saccharothrix ecbatanensis]
MDTATPTPPDLRLLHTGLSGAGLSGGVAEGGRR